MSFGLISQIGEESKSIERAQAFSRFFLAICDASAVLLAKALRKHKKKPNASLPSHESTAVGFLGLGNKKNLRIHLSKKFIVNTFTTMKRCCSPKLERNSLPYSNLMFINLTSLSVYCFRSQYIIPFHILFLMYHLAESRASFFSLPLFSI